jgi:hypothetical protein
VEDGPSAIKRDRRKSAVGLAACTDTDTPPTVLHPLLRRASSQLKRSPSTGIGARDSPLARSDTESRHDGAGPRRRSRGDGVDVCAAHGAREPRAQPRALGFAVLGLLQWFGGQLVAPQRQRPPTPAVRHERERANAWRGALAICRVQQPGARAQPRTRTHQLERLDMDHPAFREREVQGPAARGA